MWYLHPLFPTKWYINTITIYGNAGARIIIRSHDPSPPGMLSWGFMTSGNSGGVDRGAMATGSNSPSSTNKITKNEYLPVHNYQTS